MALTIQGWGSKKKKVTTTGGRELLAKRKKEREERDSKKTTRIKTIRGEKVTQWWNNKAKRWVNRRPARPSEAVGTTEQKTKVKIQKAKKKKQKVSPEKNPDLFEKDYTPPKGEVVIEGGKEKKSETLKIRKSDKKKFPGGKGEYTAFERSGARQSSARNSIARQKYLKKKRDKLKAGK